MMLSMPLALWCAEQKFPSFRHTPAKGTSQQMELSATVSFVSSTPAWVVAALGLVQRFGAQLLLWSRELMVAVEEVLKSGSSV